MTFLDIINLYKGNNGLLIVSIIIMCTLVEITPIKISPLSWLSRLINKGIRPLIQQVTDEVANNLKRTITEEIQIVNKKIDENRIREIRWQIITFANTLPNGDRDAESFENIYDLHDEYEKLLDKCKMKNGKVDRAMAKINIYYNELIEQEHEDSHD